jgi:hypothetical protein
MLKTRNASVSVFFVRDVMILICISYLRMKYYNETDNNYHYSFCKRTRKDLATIFFGQELCK